ncbi:hypothetical protein BDZ89DRAFT_1234600 [Hymenopellis radicata]|nr:hypothetical protein BDZ89DRAFT_1234600 [Hymenopellis radicata]
MGRPLSMMSTMRKGTTYSRQTGRKNDIPAIVGSTAEFCTTCVSGHTLQSATAVDVLNATCESRASGRWRVLNTSPVMEASIRLRTTAAARPEGHTARHLKSTDNPQAAKETHRAGVLTSWNIVVHSKYEECCQRTLRVSARTLSVSLLPTPDTTLVPPYDRNKWPAEGRPPTERVNTRTLPEMLREDVLTFHIRQHDPRPRQDARLNRHPPVGDISETGYRMYFVMLDPRAEYGLVQLPYL